MFRGSGTSTLMTPGGIDGVGDTVGDEVVDVVVGLGVPEGVVGVDVHATSIARETTTMGARLIEGEASPRCGAEQPLRRLEQ
jgi:hypothetical protein